MAYNKNKKYRPYTIVLIVALCTSSVMLVAQQVVGAFPEIKKIKEKQQRRIVDRIVARVNGVNILQSDLEKSRIAKEGGTFSLDEAIIEELLYQRAAEMHMLPSVLDIDRQLTTFKIQNNLIDLSDREFEDQLHQNGFTLKMYKIQLGRLIAVENIKRAEISERIIVTTQEVEEYYKKNPDYTLDEYELATYDLSNEEDGIKKEDVCKKSDSLWDYIGWVARRDLGKQFESVFLLQKGDVSEPILINGVLQFVKILDKRESRLKTLNERYPEIERYLQQERKEKFVQKIEQELKAKASIVYLPRPL